MLLRRQLVDQPLELFVAQKPDRLAAAMPPGPTRGVALFRDGPHDQADRRLRERVIISYGVGFGDVLVGDAEVARVGSDRLYR